MKQLKKYISCLLVIVSIYSCNISKHVPAGDKLYTGASIKTDSVKLSKDITAALKQSIKPKPNSSFLGIRYRLLIFNLLKEPKKKKGFFYKLKYKIGEPPVLLSQVSTKGTEKKIASQLFANGWLRPVVKAETILKKKKASVHYSVDPGVRYSIGNVFFPADSSVVAGFIRASSEKSLLHKGDFINLESIRAETERIDLYLKDNGFYYFEPGNLLVRIDSLHSGHADLYVTLKEGLSENSLKPWRLGVISVYSNYTLEKDSLIRTQKGMKYKDYWLIDRKQKYKPSVFDKAILFKKDSLYQRYRHSLTIERLMNLNTFRFVRIAFTPDRDSTQAKLDTRIYITPATKQTLRFELSGNTKSTGYVGTDISLNYRNVNLLKGAEILELKVTGGFDWQIGGKQLSPNAQLLNAEANLYIPKLLFGFPVKIKRNPYIPRTVFSTSVEYLRKPDLYLMRSLRFSAGYNWKEGRSIEHTIKLININSIDPSNITPKFEAILADDIALRASFEKQLIIGSKYQFQYNNTYLTQKKFNLIFNGSLGLSGNIASLFLKSDGESVGGKKIFNMPVSQFVRAEADLTTYWHLHPKWLLASRINGGIAMGYGNSSTVPYSEQFFIGGGSSLRAFRVRTLGPGSYRTSEATFRANESGEIKIEGNTELRYDLNRYIKLAAFVDAGNIWLRKDAADKPGSGFDKGDFLKELAVGTGIGLRVDVSVMVIRFDVAFPLRKPWYPDGERWVFNEIDFGSSSWRKENLILNIGIGYPF